MNESVTMNEKATHQLENHSTSRMEALSLEELDSGLIEKWKQLDLDTEVANPFLSCGFV